MMSKICKNNMFALFFLFLNLLILFERIRRRLWSESKLVVRFGDWIDGERIGQSGVRAIIYADEALAWTKL